MVYRVALFPRRVEREKTIVNEDGSIELAD
jgi:hypothetical protein